MRILSGLSRAEAGQILWDGTLIDELGASYRCNLFYLGHQNALQDALTGDENLTFCAALAGAIPSRADTANAMARIGLRNCKTRLVRHLSQGQKRRVALSRLVFKRASLWVLDEPFVGLGDRKFNRPSPRIVAWAGRGKRRFAAVLLLSELGLAVAAVARSPRLEPKRSFSED